MILAGDGDCLWVIKRYNDLTDESALRLCREVVTERDLFNCAGTFYELPANNADGFAKIRPIASHNFGSMTMHLTVVCL